MAHTQVATTQLGSFLGRHRLTGALQKAWARYWEYRAERATIMVLRALDDRTLKDIGMDRSEIDSVVLGGTRASSECGGRRIRMSPRL